MNSRMILAPIVLFVYNRPWHTQQTIAALQKNQLALESELIIFSDGAKTDTDSTKLLELRSFLKTITGFKKITIIERKTNLGLANSIITGLTEIVNQYEKVIVLEDDIVASKGFLKYMNEALNLYYNESQVGCIHAWNYELHLSTYNESTFFLRGADCWGWATWKRAWDEFNPDGKKLLKAIETNNLEYEFNRKNTHYFVEMLKNQIEGKNDSWAIRWHASLFIKNMYCLHPTRPIVKNIGLDNSGFHCGELYLIQNPVDFIEIREIRVKESDWFIEAYKELIKGSVHLSKTKWQRLKSLIKQLYQQ